MSVRPESRAGVEDRDLSGETVLVTGSTDGVGREAALALGRLGAEVIVHGRSREKAENVVADIESTGGEAAFYTADFGSLEAVRELAETVREHGPIDALANNAGTYFRSGTRRHGVEATMVVNHLAPFLLTHLLLPAMPADGRIVTTASAAHRGADLDLDALADVEDYDGFATYARSKLANVLFTRELARRLEDRTANCVHPGFVPGSALWRGAPVYVRGTMRLLRALPDPVTRAVADTPATGAATLVYLLASPAVEGTTGEYVVDCEPRTPSEVARDDALARRLWEWSESALDIDPSNRFTRS